MLLSPTIAHSSRPESCPRDRMQMQQRQGEHGDATHCHGEGIHGFPCDDLGEELMAALATIARRDAGRIKGN